MTNHNRKPIDPSILMDALQDRVHADCGSGAIRTKPIRRVPPPPRRGSSFWVVIVLMAMAVAFWGAITALFLGSQP